MCHGVTPRPPVKHSCHATGLKEFNNPTIKQALSSFQKQQWIEAISEELESLLEAETWDAVPHSPPGKRVLPSQFVLKVKVIQTGQLNDIKLVWFSWGIFRGRT
jgi:RecA-family ATPase